MSLLGAAVLRPGPSTLKHISSRVGPHTTTRGIGGKPKTGKAANEAAGKIQVKKGKVVERDATGQIVRQTMAKSAGAFRPMSASQLATRVVKATSTTSANPAINKLFEPPTSNPLNLPLFEPKPKAIKEMVGSAAAFVLPENDPLRVFGLPKKMLLEFRILSKPCSVVRQVTADAIEMSENAKTRSCLESRVVLTGRAGNGKSFLLLQAVEYCINSGFAYQTLQAQLLRQPQIQHHWRNK